MARKVKWSPEAVEDIESIIQYIARDSQFYAHATVSKILDFSRSLANFPQMGRIVPECNNRLIREKLVYSYRLVYLIERESILIIAVIHDKRLFSSVVPRLKT